MSEKELPMPGEKLDNGAIVVAIKTVHNPLAHYVLGLWYKAGNPEYVTWDYSRESEVTHWGHYFGSDFKRAAEDFFKRGE